MLRTFRALALFAFFLIPVAIAGVAPSHAAGPDDGLYAPVPPEGSAFVRFVQADPTIKEDLKPGANGKTYDGRDFAQVSPYYVVPQGKASFSFGPTKAEHDVVSGKFYTVALTSGGKLGVLEDTAAENRAKALLQLYNLTSQKSLSLKTGDGKIEIVPDTASGASGAREINAVKVSLSVFGTPGAGQEPLGDALLERGKALGVFAFDNGIGGVRIVQATASTDTTK